MRVLITRPRDDAGPLAEMLAALGVESLIEPMLEIRFLAGECPDLDGVQAVALTSANGARALAARVGRRDIPVLAVGEATAAAARAAGFADVAMAGGDVAALAALARERCAPGAGPLLHVSGSVVAGDLAGSLEAEGFTVRRATLYEALASGALSDAARVAIVDGSLDAVLLFSPRTARTFVTLAADAGLGDALGNLRALCLSEAVAEAVRPFPWREVRVAERPDQSALLALVAP